MQELMAGFCNNTSIAKLTMNESDLRDEHGIFILQMIRQQAEKRDQGQWTEGLRQQYDSKSSQKFVTLQEIEQGDYSIQ
jgi:hypothetical protein